MMRGDEASLQDGRWVPFSYRAFHDVPRDVVVLGSKGVLLITCPFDEAAEDYGGLYEVYWLPPETDLAGSWWGLEGRARRMLGSVPVNAVRFDASKRVAFDLSSLGPDIAELLEGQLDDVAKATETR